MTTRSGLTSYRGRTATILLVLLFLVLVAVFVSRSVGDAAGGLAVEVSDLPYLAPALVTTIIAALLYGLIWGEILRALKGSRRRATAETLRVFGFTWLARYVPGTVPYHASRVMMADQLDASRQTVAASVGYEAVLSLGAAAALGFAAVAAGLGPRVVDGPQYLFALLPLAALPLLLQPRVLSAVANAGLAKAGRQPIGTDALLSSRTMLVLFCEYAAVHLLTGLSFYFVALAVAPGADLSPALVTGAYMLAGAAGVAAFFVPSGLGVREAVIAGLLGTVMPVPTALLAAASARAVTIVADLALVALVLAFEACRKGRRSLRHSRADRKRRTVTGSVAGVGADAEN